MGVVMYLAAAFLFALNGVIAKNALNTGFDAVHLTQLRNAGAMLVLVACAAAPDERANAPSPPTVMSAL